MSRSAIGPRVLGGLVVAVALYYGVWGGEYSAFDLRRLREREQEAARNLEATRLQVDSLRREAELLERDPATLERIARERFGMIRQGELLYRFVEIDSVTPRVASAP